MRQISATEGHVGRKRNRKMGRRVWQLVRGPSRRRVRLRAPRRGSSPSTRRRRGITSGSQPGNRRTSAPCPIAAFTRWSTLNVERLAATPVGTRHSLVARVSELAVIRPSEGRPRLWRDTDHPSSLRVNSWRTATAGLAITRVGRGSRDSNPGTFASSSAHGGGRACHDPQE